MKLNNSTKATSLKQFKLDPRKNGGIARGILEKVEVTTSTIENDSAMISFRGMEIPRLSFVFKSAGDPVGVKPSYYIHSYMPIEHTPQNVFTDTWKADAMAQMIKHFHQVLSGREDFTDEELKMVAFNLEEVDADNSFIEHEADAVIAAWTSFFNGVSMLFNGITAGKKANTTPLFKNDKGQYKSLNIKLLLNVLQKGQFKPVNNGNPGFPLFPGEGVIEIYNPSVETQLRINITKESIIPIAPSAPKPNLPNMGGAANGMSSTSIPNQDLPDYMQGGAAGDDVPY